MHLIKSRLKSVSGTLLPLALAFVAGTHPCRAADDAPTPPTYEAPAMATEVPPVTANNTPPPPLSDKEQIAALGATRKIEDVRVVVAKVEAYNDAQLKDNLETMLLLLTTLGSTDFGHSNADEVRADIARLASMAWKQKEAMKPATRLEFLTLLSLDYLHHGDDYFQRRAQQPQRRAELISYWEDTLKTFDAQLAPGYKPDPPLATNSDAAPQQNLNSYRDIVATQFKSLLISQYGEPPYNLAELAATLQRVNLTPEEKTTVLDAVLQKMKLSAEGISQLPTAPPAPTK